jgi:hypothetical protein
LPERFGSFCTRSKLFRTSYRAQMRESDSLCLSSHGPRHSDM